MDNIGAGAVESIRNVTKLKLQIFESLVKHTDGKEIKIFPEEFGKYEIAAQLIANQSEFSTPRAQTLAGVLNAIAHTK